MKKKFMALALTATMLGTLLTGCGDSNKPASTQGSSQTPASVAESKTEQPGTASGEKQKLSISVWDNATTPQFQVVVDAFEAANPDVDVEIIDTQSDEYDNKLTVMLAGGDSDPDVIFVKNAETQTSMKEKGQLLSLDEFVKADGTDMSLYGDVAELLKMDGSQYTLPFRKDWYVLYYNKDLFDKAGEAYPSDDMTWEEYEALAGKMTSGEGSSKVYGSHNHTWMALVSNWAVQDGKNTLMAEDYSFLQPYYEQAVRMQDEGILQSYANLKTGSIHYISVFEQQQCAMLPMGSWFIGTLIKDKNDGKYDFNWGVTRIPHPEGVEAGTTVGSVTPVGINAKTDVPELAWKFIKFATGEEGAGILADTGTFPAVVTETVADKLAAIEGFPEDGKKALMITGFALDRPLDAKMSSVRKVIEEEHDLIMIGEEKIDEGIANMNKRAEEARNN